MTREKGWRDPRPHPWGNKYTAILFFIFTIALFLLYQQLPKESPPHVSIGTAPPSGAQLSDTHQPVTESVRQQVLSEFMRLRAQYRQAQTDIWVLANNDSPATQTVAANLNQWLSAHQLRSSEHPEITVPDSAFPLQLIHPPQQSLYAQDFAKSLSPYLSGTVELRSEPQLKPGMLRLIINQPAQFGEDGRAYF